MENQRMLAIAALFCIKGTRMTSKRTNGPIYLNIFISLLQRTIYLSTLKAMKDFFTIELSNTARGKKQARQINFCRNVTSAVKELDGSLLSWDTGKNLRRFPTRKISKFFPPTFEFRAAISSCNF